MLLKASVQLYNRENKVTPASLGGVAPTTCSSRA